MNTSIDFQNGVSSSLRSELPLFTTLILGSDTNGLTWTMPRREYERTPNLIEILVIRVSEDGDPIAIYSSLKKAYGTPLFSNALVEVVEPTIAIGPLVSVKEARGNQSVKLEGEDEKSEEPSFLRKYWWVILGVILISSLTGVGESAEPAGSSATSPNSN